MDDSMDPAADLDGIIWQHSTGVTAYETALADMEVRATAIRDQDAAERIWLVEHPPLYTAGTSADPAELIDARFPVHKTGRGGRYTYHGPGQRVGYVQFDLIRRGRDVRCFVHGLEDWVIGALARLGVEAWQVDGRVGIWTRDDGREAKIGAIGVRVRRWVTLHGFAVNVDPDLSHFGGIVPCGLPDFPVTSLARLGFSDAGPALDAALRATAPAFVARLGAACAAEVDG